MTHQSTKTHGRNLNTHYYEEEANLKGYILYYSNLYDILEKENYGDNKKISGFLM